MTVKERVRQVIDSLPEEASLDDIMHALYVHAKFQRGEAEIRQGRGVSHAAAKKRLQRWVK